MNTITKLLLAAVISLGLSDVGLAQTTPTRTTLGAALSGGNGNNVVTLASNSGIAASTASAQTFIMVDRELMQVRLVSGTTFATVNRAAGQNAVPHASGAPVWYGTGGTFNVNSGTSYGVFIAAATSQPSGACTRSNQQYLPLFSPSAGPGGYSYDCLGGVWVQGTLEYVGQVGVTKYCTEPVGSVAYGSVGTSTAMVSGTVYVGSVWVPYTRLFTGVTALVNGTVATDKIIGAVYDGGNPSGTGALLANSALAGATTAGANTFNALAFTATKVLIGPARYFIAVQGGTTATDGIRTIAVSTFIDVLGNSRTGTFGTLPATITVPTSLTADTAPVSCLY